MKQYFIYIVTNKGRTTLYIGVTNSLARRIFQHRQGEIPGFSKLYNTNRMVYYEKYNDVRDAIAREKQLKGWSRKKKDELISNMNPDWTDLAVTVLGMEQAPSRRWQERPNPRARSLDKLGMTKARTAKDSCESVEKQHIPRQARNDTAG